jgi:membrane associated rhomboid family serine protease
MFIPIGIPAPLFGILYLGYEFYMSRKAKDNIGHDAHFWGALFGVLFTIILCLFAITEIRAHTRMPNPLHHFLQWVGIIP